MSKRILWLMPSGGYSDKQKYALELMMKGAGINVSDVFYYNLHRQNSPLIKFRTKKIRVLNEDKLTLAYADLNKIIRNLSPGLIVCNDLAALWMITGSDKLTQTTTRGSVYLYPNRPDGVPVIPIDTLLNMYAKTEGKWLFTNDFQKIGRWQHDKQRQEPKFNYTVCHTVEDVRACVAFLKQSKAFSVDSETRRQFITCIGYTGVVRGQLQSFVIPFFNPLQPEACHWRSEADEIAVWGLVRELHSCDAIKILQNGSYDSAYFVRYRVPLVNYFIDTANQFHSVFTEAEKKLNFIASLVLDYSRYWKDENKGVKEDVLGSTPESMERYWRYNALDTYYTFLAGAFLSMLLCGKGSKWTLENYAVEFELSVGPAFVATMTGMRVHVGRQTGFTDMLERQHTKELAELRMWVGDGDFNPGSADQVATLLYDVLRAVPIEIKNKRADLETDSKGRSTDEKVLKLVGQQHPFIDLIIKKIWAVKKPLNNRSKYGVQRFTPSKTGTGKGTWRGLRLLNGRYVYALSASGTETGRFAGKGHHFWIGTNPQNVPIIVRSMCIADPGTVYFEADFAQSDARFVAFESEDLKYINTVSDLSLDTHCFHAAHFFKRPYDVILAGHQADDPLITHPLTGIRNITKRAVHGANYQMSAWTLYVQMGKPAVIAAAKALGFDREREIGDTQFAGVRGVPFESRFAPVDFWSQTQLVAFVDVYLLEEYHKLYTGLRPWFETSCAQAIQNGNRVTCAFDRTRLFFGNLSGTSPQSRKAQRELSAYLGQGGTAGNINRSLLELYYNQQLSREGVLLITQTHDSILYQIPIQKLHSVARKILTVMEKPFTIKGRELFIPADAKVGLSWGKAMIKYTPETTIEQIEASERKMAIGLKEKFNLAA